MSELQKDIMDIIHICFKLMTSTCWRMMFISKKKNYVGISKKEHNLYLQNGPWTHARRRDKIDVGPASLFFFIIYFRYFTKYKENFTSTCKKTNKISLRNPKIIWVSLYKENTEIPLKFSGNYENTPGCVCTHAQPLLKGWNSLAIFQANKGRFW